MCMIFERGMLTDGGTGVRAFVTGFPFFFLLVFDVTFGVDGPDWTCCLRRRFRRVVFGFDITVDCLVDCADFACFLLCRRVAKRET